MREKATKVKAKVIIHKPEEAKKRLAEAVLGVLVLFAVFLSVVIYRSEINQSNANLVLGSYYWWFLGVIALVTAAFSVLVTLLLLKIHKHPLPIFSLLLAILCLTLLLASGWLPVIRF